MDNYQAGHGQQLPPPLPPRSPRPDASSPGLPPQLPPRPLQLVSQVSIPSDAGAGNAIRRRPVPPSPPSTTQLEPEHDGPNARGQVEGQVVDGPQDVHTEGEALADDIERMLKDMEISSDPKPSAVEFEQPAEPPAAAQEPPGNTQENFPPPPSSSPPREELPPKKADIKTTIPTCVTSPMALPMTWYAHPEAPDAWICSHCYETHLEPSGLGKDLKAHFLDDKIPRMCNFNKPRVIDCLLPEAKAAESLTRIIDFLNLRKTIPNCKGIAGAKGEEGIKWFAPKDARLQGMVVCEACFQDRVLRRPVFADRFEPAKHPQGAQDVWACDISLDAISRQFNKRAEQDDWDSFVADVIARLQTPPCPKAAKVPTGGRSWFAVYGHPGLVFCAACYDDTIVGTGQEDRFQPSTETSHQYPEELFCLLGSVFCLTIALGAAHTREDFSLFWDVFHTPSSCINPDASIQGDEWWTLPSRPPGFGICSFCRAGVARTFELADHLVRGDGPPPKHCCVNPAAPRGAAYVRRVVEGYFTRSFASLESFASDFAALPQCRGRKDLEGRPWYGWPECTICPECYVEACRGTPLDAHMPWKAAVREGSTVCEMYSPRMRTLYAAACARAEADPDAVELRNFSAQRRQVYIRTVMRIERLLVDQRLEIGRQQMLFNESMFYTFIGNSQANVMGSDYRYNVPGVGYGYQNQNQATGAIKGREAVAAGSKIASGGYAMQIRELEVEWAMVE